MNIKQSLRSNIVSLGGLQALNFLLTLSVLPYLVRLFGAAGWGRIVFVQMIINYLIWITNWGFYWGGAKEVSKCRNNPLLLKRIFGVIWGAQWLLTLAALSILLFALWILPVDQNERGMYLVGAGLIIGGTLTPIWYYNGLEKIKEAAILQVLVKLIAIPCIFLIVRSESDLVLYFVINSLSAILVGTLSVLWLIYSKEVEWYRPSLVEIKSVITHEFRWFKSSMLANLNGSLIPTLLGLIGGPAELGLYNLADRLRLATVAALNPVIHAVFPRMSYLFAHSHGEALELLRKVGLLMVGLSLCACLPLLFFPLEILALVGGKDFESAKSILRWLALTPLFSIAISFFLYQILIPNDVAGGYNRVMIAALCLTAVFIYPLEHFWGGTGAAILVFFIELFSAGYLGFIIYKRKLLKIQGQNEQ